MSQPLESTIQAVGVRACVRACVSPFRLCVCVYVRVCVRAYAMVVNRREVSGGDCLGYNITVPIDHAGGTFW